MAMSILQNLIELSVRYPTINREPCQMNEEVLMKDTGGSAFPVMELLGRNGDVAIYAETGMTLRDYFAGQAITVMMGTAKDMEQAAFWAYETADAMLKARSE